MTLESTGILIDLYAFGERDCVATVFTRDFGVMRGIMKAAQIAKKNKPLVGQMGAVSWNARLDSQLGAFHFESQKNLAAPLMSDAAALAFMNSAFALIATMLPEREKYPNLYNQTENLLNELETQFHSDKGGNSPNTLYLNWEIWLLRELGYAMDLTKCSGCGATDALNYISPKTGRAVCDDCAAPYLDRLHRMPPDFKTILFFIEKICDEHNVKLPLARKMLVC